MQAASAQKDKLKFAGKQYDPDTKLQLVGARQYDPAIGRFMGVDPQEADPNKIHSINRYAYANNNPQKYVDPDGHSPIDLAFLVYDVGALASAVYHGDGVGGAAFDVGLSLVGVISPIPGAGQAIKAARAATHAVDAVKTAERGIEVAKEGAQIAKEIGIIRDAAKGKGNFGLGSASMSEADILGKSWVGEGYKTASDGKTLLSQDGLRQFRPPSTKPNSPHATTGVQANFEQRFVPEGRWQSNGHLDITP